MIARKAPPAPCSAWGACTKTRARRLRRLFMPSATSNRQVATTRQRWAAKRSEQRGGAGGKPPASWSRAQRLAVVYWNGENQGEAGDYRNENIPIRLIDLSHDKNDDVSTPKKIGASSEFSASLIAERKSEDVPIYTRRGIRTPRIHE